MKKKPLVYSIIVTYNGVKWIKKCLDSLLSSDLSTEIILIDNNSSDATVDFVSNNFPTVIILENKLNLGFGKANNLGISYALSKGADYVFLLNQDAYVNNATLNDLVTISLENQDYGILSPIQLNYEGDEIEKYFKNFIKNNAAIDFFTDSILKKEINKIYKVDFIQAAVWLLPARVFYDVGGFDPIFFHYGEDDNFCQRVKYHDYLIGISPNVYAYHNGTNVGSDNEIRFSKNYYQNLENALKAKYANINLDLNKEKIIKMKLDILKLIIKNIVKLNFKNSKGYYKEFMLLQKVFKPIEVSRKLNITKNSHYLNF